MMCCSKIIVGLTIATLVAFVGVEGAAQNAALRLRPTLENVPADLLATATKFITSLGNSTLTSMVQTAIQSSKAGEVMRIFGEIINGTMGVSEDVEVTQAQNILTELEKCVRPTGGTGTGAGTGTGTDVSAVGTQRQGGRQQQAGGRTGRQGGRQSRTRNGRR